jgi:hypothetical protein
VQEVFGFVKRKLSEAKRRQGVASGERGAGKGRQPLSPPQHTVTPSATALGTDCLILRALTYSPSMGPFVNVNNHSTGKNQSGRLKCFP